MIAGGAEWVGARAGAGPPGAAGGPDFSHASGRLDRAGRALRGGTPAAAARAEARRPAGVGGRRPAGRAGGGGGAGLLPAARRPPGRPGPAGRGAADRPGAGGGRASRRPGGGSSRPGHAGGCGGPAGWPPRAPRPTATCGTPTGAKPPDYQNPLLHPRGSFSPGNHCIPCGTAVGSVQTAAGAAGPARKGCNNERHRNYPATRRHAFPSG